MYRLCGRYFQMSTPKENGGYFLSVVNLCVSVGFLFLITGTQYNVSVQWYTTHAMMVTNLIFPFIGSIYFRIFIRSHIRSWYFKTTW